MDMNDLAPGMVLKGTVRNVIDFGAFVDIGVHQDGLVHISQMTNRYIKHPLRWSVSVISWRSKYWAWIWRKEDIPDDEAIVTAPLKMRSCPEGLSYRIKRRGKV